MRSWRLSYWHSQFSCWGVARQVVPGAVTPVGVEDAVCGQSNHDIFQKYMGSPMANAGGMQARPKGKSGVGVAGRNSFRGKTVRTKDMVSAVPQTL